MSIYLVCATHMCYSIFSLRKDVLESSTYQLAASEIDSLHFKVKRVYEIYKYPNDYYLEGKNKQIFLFIFYSKRMISSIFDLFNIFFLSNYKSMW